MDNLAGFIVVAGIALAVGIAIVLSIMRQRGQRQRDEFIRAGAGSDPSPRQAADAANRRSAWMRPDGGGGL